MPLTHGGYVELMKHALGKVPDARFNLWTAYNAAGRQLWLHYLWPWRTVGPIAITIPANASEVTLPADFHTARKFSTAYREVIQVQIEDMLQMRDDNFYDATCLYVCFDTFTRVSAAETPRPRMLTWPVGSSDITLSAAYYTGWVEVGEPDKNNKPAFPPEFEHAMTLLTRAVAVHIENQTAAFEDQAVVSELSRLEASEKNRIVNHGPMGSGMPRSGLSRPKETLQSWTL